MLYVGKTCYTTAYRWRQHKTEARIARNQWPLYVAMRTHGVVNFEVETVGVVRDKRQLANLERATLARFETHLLYNTAGAGAGGRKKYKSSQKGTTLTSSHKQKIGNSLKRWWAEKRGEVNDNYKSEF